MSYNTEATQWPEISLTDSVKSLIDKLFNTLDYDGPNAGQVLAHEIFSENGVAYFGAHRFQGTAEIEKSRDNAWATVTSRRHVISKIYVDSMRANDLMFIGNVTMGLHNGKTVTGEFSGRLVINGTENQEKRITLYQVWADSMPFVKALQNE